MGSNPRPSSLRAVGSCPAFVIMCLNLRQKNIPMEPLRIRAGLLECAAVRISEDRRQIHGRGDLRMLRGKTTKRSHDPAPAERQGEILLFAALRGQMGKNQPPRRLRLTYRGRRFILAPDLSFSYTGHKKSDVLSTLQVRSPCPGGIILQRDSFRGVVSQPTTSGTPDMLTRDPTSLRFAVRPSRSTAGVESRCKKGVG